ncbi:uncharacterized protein FOMMEDRAFT_98234, partial [Fomitiporia mediterranea MF3/22]
HFLTQIPHPIHRNSEMNAILSEGLTSMHSFPKYSPQEMKHTFLHSCAHRFGLHLLESTMAIRVILSAMMVAERGMVAGTFNPSVMICLSSRVTRFRSFIMSRDDMTS